jgi:DNA (cytosine-5)-methyltransferase 1
MIQDRAASTDDADDADASGSTNTSSSYPACRPPVLPARHLGSRCMGFTFADLFAGIGGFHAALTALGGECRFVSEIDDEAREVYGLNWGKKLPTSRKDRFRALDSDIIPLTDESMRVPKTDVLAAGFPCQPFSKSGFQRGINETRGTLFFNILRVLQERRPSVIVLENVRNLAGPRHEETWLMIVEQLRQAGYKVSETPTVFSPHFLPPDKGGSPQVRDRVFICATYVGSEQRARELSTAEVVVRREVVPTVSGEDWSPSSWDLDKTKLPWNDDKPLLLPEDDYTAKYGLTDAEVAWLDVWDNFVERMWEAREGVQLPGFPLWAEDFVASDDLVVPPGTPKWKADFLVKNAKFYDDHRDAVDAWRAAWFVDPDSDDEHARWTVRDGMPHAGAYLPASRRKLEWQAQRTARLWDCIIHLRPSGIRAKVPTYLPALVAITQTSIIGWKRRRLTPVEAARLQGLPDGFTFGQQPDSATYKQLGNGVSVGAAYYVLRQHVLKDRHLIPRHIVQAVERAGDLPSVHLPFADVDAQEVTTGTDEPAVVDPIRLEASPLPLVL